MKDIIITAREIMPSLLAFSTEAFLKIRKENSAVKAAM